MEENLNIRGAVCDVKLNKSSCGCGTGRRGKQKHVACCPSAQEGTHRPGMEHRHITHNQKLIEQHI
jgi:hypothetical protein